MIGGFDFNERPFLVIWETTHACDLACQHCRAKAEPEPAPNERLQHHVLLIAFTLLAYSGFALKFPYAWWAAPFAWFDGNLDVRGWTHRVSAVVFSALAIWHAVYLVLTARGRKQLKALAPGPQDFKDLIAMLRYNLTRKGTKPEFGHYGYVEKAEYWALVWGSVIMVSTGALLWFANFSMRHWPKWVLDVAVTVHYYEAVLATLAIIVWHFYFTIFDPEHYPLNLSIFTGKEKAKSKSGDGKDETPPTA